MISLPEKFDSRKEWSYCPSISLIATRGKSNHTWAIATASAITDRSCIASKGKFLENISSQDLICSFRQFNGNQGNKILDDMCSWAWKYWVNKGLTTGGYDRKVVGCLPFNPENQNDCSEKCSKPVKYYGKVGSFNKLNTEAAMKEEIYKNGPITAAFDFHIDFFSYKSGVFPIKMKSLNDLPCERYYVKIFGWGVEKGLPYWHISASQGPNFGINGTVKFLRGQNHLDIESNAYSATPGIEMYLLYLKHEKLAHRIN